MLSVVNEKDMSIEGKNGEKELKRSTTVENSLQINPFYAKQTQFQKWQKNINTYLTMRYRNLDTLMGVKTKPKQTQLKPIQTQFKPNKAKNKANSKPIKPNFKRQISVFSSQMKPNSYTIYQLL